MLLFSQYARNVHFPLPIYKAKKGWTSYRLQVFKMFPVSTQHAVSACIQTVSRLFAFIPIINIFLSCKSQIIQQSKCPSPQVVSEHCVNQSFFPLLVKWLKTPLNYLFAALNLIYTFFMKRSQITFMSFYWPQVLCCNAFKLIIKWIFFPSPNV